MDFGEISQVEAVTYRPLASFGGWGTRWGGPGNMAYNVSGRRGVRLDLTNGKTAVVDSPTAAASAASSILSVVGTARRTTVPRGDRMSRPDPGGFVCGAQRVSRLVEHVATAALTCETTRTTGPRRLAKAPAN
jgi:hypothetical protein